jgi:hypothetical protein
MKNTVDVKVVSPSPSDCILSQVGMFLILKSTFTTSMEERERCYSFVLSRTPHNTIQVVKYVIHFVHRSTALHSIHLQFDISNNAFEIRAVQSSKCIVWCANDCTRHKIKQRFLHSTPINVSWACELDQAPFASDNALSTEVRRCIIRCRMYIYNAYISLIIHEVWITKVQVLIGLHNLWETVVDIFTY